MHSDQFHQISQRNGLRIKTNLGYLGSFDEKKTEVKNLTLGHLQVMNIVFNSIDF
jgi:hypothetical protein